MQNDLISRKELIERIVNRTGSTTVLFNTTEELNAYLEGCAFKQNDIIDIIDEIPCAYDVEKVVAELEEYIEYDTFDYHKEDPLINMSFEKLEDIICNGGKE